MSVSDDDITSNASDIRFKLAGSDAGKFSIDEVSGEITVAAETSFDSETKDKYFLKVPRNNMIINVGPYISYLNFINILLFPLLSHIGTLCPCLNFYNIKRK